MQSTLPILPPQIVPLGLWKERLSSCVVTDTITIGRLSICDMVVPSRWVSRTHARIERHEHSYLLIDLDSINGTFVNRCQIDTPYVLCSGDAIGLGQPAPMLRFDQGSSAVRSW